MVDEEVKALLRWRASSRRDGELLERQRLQDRKAAGCRWLSRIGDDSVLGKVRHRLWLKAQCPRLTLHLLGSLPLLRLHVLPSLVAATDFVYLPAIFVHVSSSNRSLPRSLTIGHENQSEHPPVYLWVGTDQFRRNDHVSLRLLGTLPLPLLPMCFARGVCLDSWQNSVGTVSTIDYANLVQQAWNDRTCSWSCLKDARIRGKRQAEVKSSLHGPSMMLFADLGQGHWSTWLNLFSTTRESTCLTVGHHGRKPLHQVFHRRDCHINFPGRKHRS